MEWKLELKNNGIIPAGYKNQLLGKYDNEGEVKCENCGTKFLEEEDVFCGACYGAAIQHIKELLEENVQLKAELDKFQLCIATTNQKWKEAGTVCEDEHYHKEG